MIAGITDGTVLELFVNVTFVLLDTASVNPVTVKAAIFVACWASVPSVPTLITFPVAVLSLATNVYSVPLIVILSPT